MSWDKEKMGFYCDRCGASIWMDQRQQRFLAMNPAPGVKASDPYLSVNHHAFFEEGKRGYTSSGFQYCYDCEPVVMNVLAALNKETK